MKSIKGLITYWGQLFYLPVNALAHLVPRDKNLWLFGSTFGRRFADNPRYFYSYICQHSIYASGKIQRQMLRHVSKGGSFIEDENCKLIRPVWISADKDLVEYLKEHGYPACYSKSFKGKYYALRAGFYFYDNYSKDINYPLSGGAIKVNMWHGIPLKKIQHDNIHDSYRHPENKLQKLRNIPRNISDEKPEDYVLTTSNNLRSTFSSAFKTDKVLTCGYPRVDSVKTDTIKCLLTPSEKIVKYKLSSMKKHHKGAKICLYIPTFRDSESKFFELVNMARLNAFLDDQNIILVVKAHMKSKLKEAFSRIEGERVLTIPANDDVSRFMLDSDLLITDYSSAYFDYLWIDKPIVFFDYDLREYLSDSREMYYDYNTVTPGYKASNLDELFEAVEDSLRFDIYKKERLALRKQMFDDDFETASTKLVEELSKLL
ncbi:MAG: CDP-glycerol glycerophosphotransferase family protein [Lachnospiraceae bacterium]|nr:CDP-glycerol glycerophosphotransferase family protein [Lachnospiraceae bacterium]